jgi:hypothetical protein
MKHLLATGALVPVLLIGSFLLRLPGSAPTLSERAWPSLTIQPESVEEEILDAIRRQTQYNISRHIYVPASEDEILASERGQPWTHWS